MNEWWNAYNGNMIGAYGGAAIGVLGGTLGALAGTLAPRGKCKGLILGGMIALALMGVVLLVAGITAVIVGQPYHVWYPLVLGGGILTVVCGPLVPVIRLRYRQAEARRLDAEELRRG